MLYPKNTEIYRGIIQINLLKSIYIYIINSHTKLFNNENSIDVPKYKINTLDTCSWSFVIVTDVSGFEKSWIFVSIFLKKLSEYMF